jgi:G:T-mismatch repair DNA endonuclease (very short patch repair protein)
MSNTHEMETVAGLERASERRLRRKARRMGFVLNKRRGAVANRNGPNYMLVDAHHGTVVLHDGGCYWNRVTLDEVERHLRRE